LAAANSQQQQQQATTATATLKATVNAHAILADK